MTELEHAMSVDPNIKTIKEQVDTARAAWEAKPSETTQENLKAAESALRAQIEAFRERSRPGGIPVQGITRQSLAGKNAVDDVRDNLSKVHPSGIQHAPNAEPERSVKPGDSDSEDPGESSGGPLLSHQVGNQPERDAVRGAPRTPPTRGSTEDLGAGSDTGVRLNPTIKQRRAP